LCPFPCRRREGDDPLKALKANQKKTAVLLAVVFLILFLLSLFSSSLPDGLEWTLQKLNIEPDTATSFTPPLQDYTLSSRFPAGINQLLSGLLGAMAMAVLVFTLFKIRKS
ncbi:MAG: PDGLE domain-containing protein, partial [Calditrichia bacterium]